MRKKIIGSIVILCSIIFVLSCKKDKYNGIYIEDIVISGTSVNGVQYTITENGDYRFLVKSGSIQISPYPDNIIGEFGWTTKINIYKNGPIERKTTDYQDLINYDYTVGGNDENLTEAAAANQGKGKYVNIILNAGDYLIFVVNDGANCGDNDCYWDNSGSVTLAVYRE
jgi:hypothetical protein